VEERFFQFQRSYFDNGTFGQGNLKINSEILNSKILKKFIK